MLGEMQSLKTGFYLTGGTALGRCYLNHRYSDDLDFFVNDVAFHAGTVEIKNGFGRVDSWRNILSNKICAMSRMEPKDYADILYIADTYAFQWQGIIGEAREKDLWVDPLEVSRMIHQFPVEHLRGIKWTGTPPVPEISRKAVNIIAEDILNGRENRMRHLFKNSHSCPS